VTAADRLRALALASAALLAPSPAPAQDADAATEEPWEGLLPDPDQGHGADGQPGSWWFGLRALDAGTGRPVAGARIRRYPEWIQGGTLRHSFLVGLGETDADGFARVPSYLDVVDGDSHWVVDAPGFAPAYHYGAYPDRTVLLRRGRDLRGRVLDPLGRPAGGASIELFLGCGHGPAVRTAVAGPDGVFTLPGVTPGEGTLWIRSPAGAADYFNLGPSRALGDRPEEFLLSPGATAAGRVVDASVDPIPGAIVRSWQEQRGPAAATGEDGRFVLEGVEPGFGFQVFHPSPVGDERTHFDSGWVEGVPIVVRMTAAGPVEPPDETGTLVLRAGRADGKPAAGVRFDCVRLDDGSGDDGVTSDGGDGEDAPEGEARIRVGPGTWRVMPGSAFEEETFAPVEVAVPDGGVGEAAIALRPQARLRIEGEFSAAIEDLELAVPGELLRAGDGDGVEWSPALPREGPSALRVRLRAGPVLVFPVGRADAGGRRAAAVAIPRPHRIRLPGWARVPQLLDGEHEVAAVEDGGALLTWAAGRLTVRVLDGERLYRETGIDLPADRATEVDASEALAGATPRGDARVRFLGPDGAPVEAAVEIFDRRSLSTWRGGESVDGASVEADWPCFVVARRQGWVPRTLFLDRPGPVEVRWGDASLHLEIRDGDGAPADALVFAGGAVLPAPEGRLALGGFEAGTHEVLVGLRDEPGGGRRVRVTLRAGELRRHTVVLGGE